jgi:hypothetical protein
VACLAAGAVACLAATAAAHGATVGRIVGSRVQAPVVDDNPLVLRVPLVLKRGAREGRLTAELLDVSAPGGRTASVFGRFGVELERTNRGLAHGPALRLLVPTEPPLAPGTYKLRVTLRERRLGAQRIAFSIRLDAATLRPPGTIHIKHTERWPFHDGVERHSLPLRETSRRSHLTDISVKQVDPLNAGTDQASGSIGADTPIEVVPGGFQEAALGPRGSFPIGTSTGKVEIDAGELAEPIQVSAEVTHTLSRGYLILILILGVTLGFLTRTELVGRIQRAQAFAQIQQMLSRLRRARTRHPDPAFVAMTADIEEDLRAALDSGDATKIESAVTDADAALQAALKALKEKADEVAKELTTLAATIATRRDTLPPDLAAALEEAQKTISTARGKLDAGDVGGARSLVRYTAERVTGVAADSGQTWKDAASPVVGAYGAPNRNAVASSDEAVRAKADAAAVALATPALGNRKSPATDQLAALLAAVDAVDAFVQAVASSASQIVTQLQEILPAEVNESMVAAVQALEDLGTALNAALTHRADAYADAREADGALATCIARTVVAAAQLSGAAEDPIDVALKGGDFVGAARLALAASEPAVTHAMAPEDPTVAPATPAVRSLLLVQPPAQSQLTEAASVEAALPEQSNLVVDAQAPLEVVHLQDRKELAKATAVQTVLLAVVVVILGYLTFVDQWSGTTANIVAAFVAGYLADLSVGAVTRGVEQLRGAGAKSLTPPEQPAGPAPQENPAEPGQPDKPAVPPAPAPGGNDPA